jgi:hypothetical protein
MNDLSRFAIDPSGIFCTQPLSNVGTERRVVKTLGRSTARLLRAARSVFESGFRSPRAMEVNNPRTYAALAGDGLMPEVK